MKKNFVISAIAVLGALAFALQSCTDSKGDIKSVPRNSEPVPVRVISLEKSSVSTVVKGSGQLTTDDQTILGFKTSGIVQSVAVKEGDFVKKGQILATLDLSEINSHVSQAKHAFEKAQRDFERTTHLYKDSVATLEQLQNAETALAVAKEQLNAASFNKSFSVIHAPANGYVLKKFVNAGQVVDVGDPILLTNGAGDGKWILKIGASDKQWASISLKTKAGVTVDAFPEKIFEAYVIRKSETADPQSGAFTVELRVDHNGEKFGSGMFGSAEIFSPATQASWKVPYEAVLDANDNEGFVFVTTDNKTAIKQPVTIASFDGTSIYITEGLENNMSLITSGSAYLTDKSPITVLK
jgi:RND family efflux transporter MFP subunit